MKKNAKLAALAILVLAAVAALSVGITLAVVNARMPAACTCSRGCAVRAADRAVRSGFHLHSRLRFPEPAGGRAGAEHAAL